MKEFKPSLMVSFFRNEEKKNRANYIILIYLHITIINIKCRGRPCSASFNLRSLYYFYFDYTNTCQEKAGNVNTNVKVSSWTLHLELR